LVRTGWAATYLALPATQRPATSSWNGLTAAEDTAAFLWDTGIALVGSDNPAVENAPGSSTIGSLHRRLLPALGMPLMELLDLEELAARCAEQARWDFLFIAVPMHLVGGVSSPANAIAML
jgi:kynurenine formamidase